MADYRIITISRQFGSGGRTIGKKLAEKLGIPCYDQEIIAAVAKGKRFFQGLHCRARRRRKHHVDGQHFSSGRQPVQSGRNVGGAKQRGARAGGKRPLRDSGQVRRLHSARRLQAAQGVCVCRRQGACRKNSQAVRRAYPFPRKNALKTKTGGAAPTIGTTPT